MPIISIQIALLTVLPTPVIELLTHMRISLQKLFLTTFFSDAVGTLGTIVVALGAGLAAWGIINLMEGYGGDNAQAKSSGIKQLVAGGAIALIGLTLIPMLADLFPVTP